MFYALLLVWLYFANFHESNLGILMLGSWNFSIEGLIGLLNPLIKTQAANHFQIKMMWVIYSIFGKILMENTIL